MVEFPVPTIRRGHSVLVSVALDATLYAPMLGEREFDVALECYGRLVPRERWRLFKIAENPIWDRVDRPIQPASLSRGSHPLAFLDTVRERIRLGRPVEFKIWDREDVNSWSLSCCQLAADDERHAFYRLLAPRTADHADIERFIRELASSVQITSGHGGYCFTYNFMQRNLAFSEIYKYAWRYWGIDVEYLNATLPLMNAHIKGVHWLTFLGEQFVRDRSLDQALGASSSRCVTTEVNGGLLLRLGEAPVVGDRNRPSGELGPYFDLGQALAPLMFETVPEFPGTFAEKSNTLAWARRFADAVHYGAAAIVSR
jgi:hypothetical protein